MQVCTVDPVHLIELRLFGERAIIGDSAKRRCNGVLLAGQFYLIFVEVCMSKVLLYDCMRGSKNVCLLNTGIAPPPDENSKSCPLAFTAGPSSACQQNNWSPPLK